MTSTPAIPWPRAAALAGAVLCAYVGLVHEVVGTKLYPDGPDFFGGPLGWHAAGVFGIAAGLVMVAGVLGLVRVPVVPLALVCAVVGIACVLLDALVHGGFHFFAFTLVVACAAVVVGARPAS